ncbi:TPA: hypothetical protein QDA71_001298 [Burkholderia vietnamiensis]|uniref:hypothetical protein n=1 Tax=Burkholderia vietnamiensis TaxID=60552 RepID=UPI001CF0EE69|nr:hypothetical protein [Burkholderia vietnamiensis]MCA8264802.1 hypothetical protein [Burkholderia vietnamiensis]HDR8927885.1 hypothetical protein [Burkholderia vietnamiensis]HDR8944318.1 hypothetical protein [Burkholderia vietnamiensis]HDR9210635.1 hypothetical protein [Burkholderia vietnamiensis]
MAEKLIEAVVARGRTIHDQVKEGEPPVIKRAGETVRLPEAEVKRLRDLGYLVPEKVETAADPEGVQISGGQASITRVG